MSDAATKLENFQSDKLSKFLTWCFYLGCFVGCNWQVVGISELFFSYETLTELAIEIPTDIDVPDLSICYRYVDVFDMERYVRETNITLELGTASFGDDIRKIQRTVTVFDIFEYTPQTNDIFKACRARIPGSYDYIKKLGKECYEIFTVDNFYLQEFICYRISFFTARNQTFSYRNLAYALSHPGMIFMVDIPLTVFKAADYCKAVVHVAGDYPFRSSAFSPAFARKYDRKTGTAEFNMFQLTYSLLSNNRLPAPYTTNCKDYTKDGFGSASDCVKHCLTNLTIENFDKLPFSTIVSEELKIKHITNDDISNKTFSRILNKFESNCIKKCSQLDCHEKYSITRITIEPQDGFLTYIVTAPREPSYEINFHPKLNITEYLIYLLSCFGTWFGLSVLSLNPLEWFKRKNEEKDTKERVVHLMQDQQSKARAGRRLSRVQKRISRYVPQDVEYDSGCDSSKDCAFCAYCFNTRNALRKEITEEITMLSTLLSLDMGINQRTSKKKAPADYYVPMLAPKM